jgi:hypothetical protein
MSNTSNAPSPARVLGDLADENRLRVLAAVVLGEARIARIAERASLSEEEVARALGHLGRLALLPARSAKRKLVLEYVSNRFEPKREYGEREVNAVLEEVHDDYVTLRRYLVDEGLLERNAGVYRRAGTTTT